MLLISLPTTKSADLVSQSSRHYLAVIGWGIVLLVMLCTSAFAGSSGLRVTENGILRIQQMDLLVTQNQSPPTGDLASLPKNDAWQPVNLPDRWPSERYRMSDNGWYQFNVSLAKLLSVSPSSADQAYGLTSNSSAGWGILLPRVNMNAAVYFNGNLLGDGGAFDEPLGRNWSRGLIFRIPAGLWKAGNNQVLIRLKSYPGYGLLGAVEMGPYSQLQVPYERLRFWQIWIPTGLFFVTLAIAAFMFGLWHRRRTDSIYLWFGIAALIWSFFSLNHFIAELPFSGHYWDWLLYSLTAWWTTALAIFCFRYAQLRMRKIEFIIMLWAVLSTLVYAGVENDRLRVVVALWQSGSLLIGLLVVAVLLHFWWQRPGFKRFLFLFSILCVFAAGTNDWLVQSGLSYVVWPVGTHLLPLTAPLVLMFVAWQLTGRFIAALSEAELLNNELEARVLSAREELAEQYQQASILAKNQAVNEERERIYQDLHDDVGAKLLSLIYRVKDDKGVALARSALADLRDVVTRSAQGDMTLADLAADWRSESLERFDNAGIEAHWQQDDGCLDVLLSPNYSTNLGRILREAINNSLRHSNATRVELVVACTPVDTVDRAKDCSTDTTYVLSMGVRDNARVCDPEQWRTGRGLMNMRTRVQKLGGSIDWKRADAGGCLVKWTIPIVL